MPVVQNKPISLEGVPHAPLRYLHTAAYLLYHTSTSAGESYRHTA